MNLVLAGGQTQRQIAELTNMTESSISLIINTPLFQEELARRRTKLDQMVSDGVVSSLDQAREMLRNASVPAIKKLNDLAQRSPDENVQLRAASTILKLAFDRETPQSQINNVFVLDASKLSFLKQVAEESGFIEGEKVDRPEQPSQPTTAVA